MISKIVNVNVSLQSKTAKGQVFGRRLLKKIIILSSCFGNRKVS